ncbi:putative bifunctional diguanylate cyclase/phosphodiesterase [Sphingomonas sp.]|jgi:diguanylate cyclase (GGDEF)-like protein|uniref:putative bifunctional diguanylate cyclase/phosphodiesterase n=1 Tax=Sphingomonas sp. TaxID=28214 RepID=UPI002DF55694|nr:EAL domain-containing protein [Sphingomonas sp.]
MERLTLKSRAIAFAFCSGAVAFILALFATAQSGIESGDLTRSVIIAIVCAVMSWASAERAIAGYAEAVDDSIARLAQAAEGDLTSPTPSRVSTVLPELASSLDGLLTQVRSNLDRVHTLAMFDPVTQLPNRTHFRREAGELLEALEPNEVAALFFIDLDKFKSVNDTFGHAQGDQLLIKVADRLRSLVESREGRLTFQSPPLIGRLAGDEFTMLASGLASADEAERIGDALLDTLSEPYELLGSEVEVGASIGVAIRPDQGHSLHDLMRAADIAMYHAKANGRARVQLFTPSLAARLADNMRLETELREAVEGDQFAFFFQPQLCLATGRVVGAEAVLRWRHPALGLLAPDRFLPHAEKTGLVHEIGYWAVEAIAAALGRWERLGLTTRIAANVSARQMARPDFFAQVRHALARHRASADLLELEISESIAMRCDDMALAGIARLREQGATVVIDEFGSGYSSLSRLQEMPVDRVKIAGSLITDLASSEQARTIVQSVIALVHGLGYHVAADGVESRAQRAILEVAGCDHIQGPAIAGPMAEADFHAWLSERQDQLRRA